MWVSASVGVGAEHQHLVPPAPAWPQDPEYEIDPCRRLANIGQTAWAQVGQRGRRVGEPAGWGVGHIEPMPAVGALAGCGWWTRSVGFPGSQFWHITTEHCVGREA